MIWYKVGGLEQSSGIKNTSGIKIELSFFKW